jgi:hypothetical protein
MNSLHLGPKSTLPVTGDIDAFTTEFLIILGTGYSGTHCFNVMFPIGDELGLG